MFHVEQKKRKPKQEDTNNSQIHENIIKMFHVEQKKEKLGI